MLFSFSYCCSEFGSVTHRVAFKDIYSDIFLYQIIKVPPFHHRGAKWYADTEGSTSEQYENPGAGN